MANPIEIEKRLLGLEEELRLATNAIEDGVKEYKRLGIAAAEAETTAEVEYARAYLGPRGVVAEHLRKQMAVEATAELRKEARIAKHLVSTQEKALFHLHAVRSTVTTKNDNARTLAANVRALLELRPDRVAAMTPRKHPSQYKVTDPWAPFRCNRSGCGHPVYDSAPRLGCLYCDCDEVHKEAYKAIQRRATDATATGSEGADGTAGPQDGEGT